MSRITSPRSVPIGALLACAGAALVAVPASVDATSERAPSPAAADDTHPTAPAQAEELAAPVARLVVGDFDEPTLTFVDLDDDGERHTVPLPAPAGLSSALTEDGRFVLAGHPDSVTVVDGATWTVPHGDHSHHFAGEPAALGSVEGDSPSHLISHGGVTALWFDGDGEAALLDEADLADGELAEQGRLTTAGPHHGFAVPVGDEFVTTAPGDEPGDMPDTVVVADPDGTALSEHECVESHGETTWAHGVAVACRDGVLVLTNDDGAWTSTLVAYPDADDIDPYGFGPARAWVIDTLSGGETLVAPFGAHHIITLDPHDGEATAIDIGADVAIFGVTLHESSGRLAVLTQDGAVTLVDPATQDIATTPEVVAPFTEGDPAEPYRAIVVTDDRAFVADPDNEDLVELDLTSDTPTVVGPVELGFTPGFLEIING